MVDIHVHIGAHKTGTTSIQNFLYQNTDYLISQNAYVAKAYEIIAKVRLHKIEEFDDALARTARSNFLEALDACKSNRCDKLLLSWENFSGNPDRSYGNVGILARVLANVLEGQTVKIVAYLPRQDQLVESWYMQKIKGGESYTFDEYLETHDFLFDWSVFLNTYARHFGKENINARVFSRAIFSEPEDLLRDFLSVVGIAPPPYHFITAHANPGLMPVGVEFNRLLNSHVTLSVPDRKLLRSSLEAVAAAGKDNRYSFFSPAGRRTFLSKHETANARLAAEYFSGTSDVFGIEGIDEEMEQQTAFDAKDMAFMLARTLIQLRRIDLRLAELEGSSGLRVIRHVASWFSTRLSRFPRLMLWIRRLLGLRR